MVLFGATMIGAFAVFSQSESPGLDPENITSSENTYLNILYIIAYILPMISIIYIVCAGEYVSITDSY